MRGEGGRNMMTLVMWSTVLTLTPLALDLAWRLIFEVGGLIGLSRPGVESRPVALLHPARSSEVPASAASRGLPGRAIAPRTCGCWPEVAGRLWPSGDRASPRTSRPCMVTFRGPSLAGGAGLGRHANMKRNTGIDASLPKCLSRPEEGERPPNPSPG